jgi:hypothetical protein
MPAQQFAAQPAQPFQYPAVAKVGEVAGFAAGLVVTLALRFSPKWSRPVPAGPSDGIERGGYPLQERHKPVVGPRISARADTMPDGRLRDLVSGFGDGATAAPPATFQLEARLSKLLSGT